MKLLKEIKDADYPSDESFRTREASRAILFDENNLIPILFVSKHNYHKLPGGGIDPGEDREVALARECLEEVGSEIEVDGEIGQIIEFRSKKNLKQSSYCYYGRVISKGEPSFTEKEIRNGFQVVWMTLEEALTQVENDKPENYAGTFIQERDLRLLQEAKLILKG